ncbi:MAG TPA: glycosyl hydrolase 108 family protein [Burkholderiaceae bacterium]|nr:glycosyl hydrolase 108 family protein [Burkholderiaceae bacterium]
MESASFDQSLPFVLRWEGGYVNHPADPGGATNKGVTQKVYDTWRAGSGQPVRSVREILDDEVHAIYEGGYWRPPRCDALQRRLDLVQFDTAVNMGPGRAVRFLQQAVGATVDGSFGPATEKALRESGEDLGSTLARYCDAREAFYLRLIEKNPKLEAFRRGWMNRLNALRKEIGLPGYESAAPLDFGDRDRIERVPDYGVDPAYDV